MKRGHGRQWIHMTQDAIMHEYNDCLCNPSKEYRLNLFSQLTAALLTALLVATSAVAAETRVSLPRTGLVSSDSRLVQSEDRRLGSP